MASQVVTPVVASGAQSPQTCPAVSHSPLPELTPVPAILLPSKLPNVGTTIFTVMSQLAAQAAHVTLSLEQLREHRRRFPVNLDADSFELDPVAEPASRTGGE